MLNVNKGDKVILKGFTGIKLGVFTVAKATEKNITVEKKDGSLMIFSKKDGKQTNVEEGKERYANSVMEDDGSYVQPHRGKKTKKEDQKPAKKTKKEDQKPAKKPKKQAEPDDVDEEFEDEDDDFEELD